MATRTLCMQISVEAMRWPDDMLDGLLIHDGYPLNAEGVRKALQTLKDDGFEVVPCGKHEYDGKGRCITNRPVQAVPLADRSEP